VQQILKINQKIHKKKNKILRGNFDEHYKVGVEACLMQLSRKGIPLP